MIEKFVLFSKGVALLAAAAYLLSLFFRQRKRRVPPCETCKWLKAAGGRGKRNHWVCGCNQYRTECHDRFFRYCCDYEPRTETDREGGTNDERQPDSLP